MTERSAIVIINIHQCGGPYGKENGSNAENESAFYIIYVKNGSKQPNRVTDKNRHKQTQDKNRHK